MAFISVVVVVVVPLRLAQDGHGHVVHVLENLVLAHHAPDEGVGLRADAGVDRPARADHRLLVAHDKVARLCRLAHHVEDGGVLVHVEVEIHLHAPVVRVAGHGVPQAAGLQLGHAHQQLAGGQHIGHQKLVDRAAVGVIEAKRDEAGENLSVHEAQTLRYGNATLKWRRDTKPLPFLFEATAQMIQFTDGRDPVPRAREIFHFYTPHQLQTWAREPDTLRRRLASIIPELPLKKLRDCQVSAVTGLEASLAKNKPRALVHMATGAGKTFTAITSVYRLLKFGGAKRILFLVDTRNLGKQAHQEFMAYTPPDDGRTFTELYNVQRLSSPNIDPHSQVVISTIQRMYSVLSGEPLDESAEDISLAELQQTPSQAKLVRYNASIPIESFDFIVIDECHRSIYNVWRQVLEYFDAFTVGLGPAAPAVAGTTYVQPS